MITFILAASIFLSWDLYTEPTDGFILERSADVSPRVWFRVNTNLIAPSDVSYTDNVPAGIWFWRLKAVSGTTESGYSNITGKEVAPPPPTGLSTP